MADIKNILQEIPNLTFDEVFSLQKQIDKEIETRSHGLFNEIENNLSCCPHCGSNEYIKWGNYKGTHRYKCKKCNRTFTPTTATAVHWLKKPKIFLRFCMSMFKDGISSLKKQSEEFKISQSTSFEWRHKALISFGQEAPKFTGITEIDDIWFRYSQKGRKGLKYSRKRGGSIHRGDNDYVSKVLISKEREGEFDISLIKIGRLDIESIKQRLEGKFAQTSILMSDKHPSIAGFAKTENIKHEIFKAKTHGTEKVNVQIVNNLAREFKGYLNYGLRGVSTKYLQNYANWFGLKEKFKGIKNKIKEMIKVCYSNTKSWDMYMNIELLYKNFILKKSNRTYRCPTVRYRKHQNWNYEKAISGFYI